VAFVALIVGASAAPAVPRLADAASGQAGSTVTVGIKPLDPFVLKNPDAAAAGGNAYRGFSIDLWNEIANATPGRPPTAGTTRCRRCSRT
jgi:ABC-type amino acid transport substrate-binding protein